jgi:acid stress-induced BolA-like protein IbaG/YrbA
LVLLKPGGTVFSPDRIKTLIESALPDCVAVVHSDDGEHYEGRIVSSAFVGKLPVAQHRMVYAALGDHMKSDIHAFTFKTFTPDKWQG